MTVCKKVTARYSPCDEKVDFKFSAIKSGFCATHRYVTLNGEPIVIVSGEFHFSRYDKSLWEREIVKMKAQGLNCIATYVFWNHHEIKAGVFDFCNDNDIAHFLGLCKKHGMKVVLRIGPWCHGEVKRGGFPDYLALLPGKRRSTPLYLHFVKRFWTALAEQVRQFCDGETVIAVQLENEYNGSISHIADLRKIAEECGIVTPFFTMTAWPTNTPDYRFLPLFGGYPEAPWAQNKRKLRPEGRFAITQGRSEVAIGEDLLGKVHKGADFSEFPYALCETGTGNQVTQHRRPVISENDGYGVAFAKFASGAVWLGYYMYHGGRNPSYKPMQESRRTLYPNNYPIVDYDFQAPLSKDGEVRSHADRLRLMHYFIEQNQADIARTQTFFSSDKNMPYFSYRCSENGGYVFLSNYERGADLKDETVDVAIDAEVYKVNVKSLNIAKGEMFFFPVMQSYGGIKFDYVTAQPVFSTKQGSETHVYFVKYSCGVRLLEHDKKECVVDGEEAIFENDGEKLVMHFVSLEKAKKLYLVNGKAIFSEFPLFEKDGAIFVEKKYGCDGDHVKITETAKKRLPFSSYMFSRGKKLYYNIRIDKDILKDCEDVEITIPFKGLNVQLFCGQNIVDDYFNTDGKFVFRLARLVRKYNSFDYTMRICAATATGSGNVYNEIGIAADEVKVEKPQIKKIKTEKAEL